MDCVNNQSNKQDLHNRRYPSILFKSSFFVTIPKVTKAVEYNKFRTISLISHAAKILQKVIKRRIILVIENRISGGQLGLRKVKAQEKLFLLHGL